MLTLTLTRRRGFNAVCRSSEIFCDRLRLGHRKNCLRLAQGTIDVAAQILPEVNALLRSATQRPTGQIYSNIYHRHDDS
jgi:hypothetical protein